jgi:hypothetical protein
MCNKWKIKINGLSFCVSEKAFLNEKITFDSKLNAQLVSAFKKMMDYQNECGKEVLYYAGGQFKIEKVI